MSLNIFIFIYKKGEKEIQIYIKQTPGSSGVERRTAARRYESQKAYVDIHHNTSWT